MSDKYGNTLSYVTATKTEQMMHIASHPSLGWLSAATYDYLRSSAEEYAKALGDTHAIPVVTNTLE